MSRARATFYAGWLLGTLGIFSASLSNHVAGAFMMPAGILIFLAIRWGAIEEESARFPYRFRATDESLRVTGSIVSLVWLFVGVVMALSP